MKSRIVKIFECTDCGVMADIDHVDVNLDNPNPERLYPQFIIKCRACGNIIEEDYGL